MCLWVCRIPMHKVLTHLNNQLFCSSTCPRHTIWVHIREAVLDSGSTDRKTIAAFKELAAQHAETVGNSNTVSEYLQGYTHVVVV